MWKKIFGIMLVSVLTITFGALTAYSALNPSDGGIDDPDERAIEIAKQFVIEAPTFKFDGILDTITVLDVQILESYPVQYVVTITFDSKHAGYGDRTGQQLAQVITPHHAVIKVVTGEVVSAILDGQWNELDQKTVER
jgi:hypothetical protein